MTVMEVTGEVRVSPFGDSFRVGAYLTGLGVGRQGGAMGPNKRGVIHVAGGIVATREEAEEAAAHLHEALAALAIPEAPT